MCRSELPQSDIIWGVDYAPSMVRAQSHSNVTQQGRAFDVGIREGNRVITLFLKPPYRWALPLNTAQYSPTFFLSISHHFDSRDHLATSI